MRNMIFIASVCFTLNACQSPTESVQSSNSFNMSGFTEMPVPNSTATIITKKDDSGKMLEQGIVRDGQKDGPWTLFHENESIKSLTSYINGGLNGSHLEFNNRGQLEKRVEYLDNQYHGLYGEYKYGRPLKEITYNKGTQDGPFRVWSDMGKLTQSGNNKNGKLDGALKYYDEEENLIMSYIYKDGEVVSGGLIKKEE